MGQQQGINILLIEDDPGDMFLIAEMLSGAGNDFHLEQAERLSSGLERIAGGGLDIILLDMNLPDSSGIDTLIRVLKAPTDMPIIVLTGLADEDFGTKAVKSGAQDYLVKGEIDSRILKRAISYSIERHKLESALKQANEQLSLQATTDTLTGVFNRLKFNELLDAEIKRAMRYRAPLSLVMFDLDNFKKINDTYGHSIGDHVLKETARLIAGQIRAQDFFARWGGEEFMVLVPNTDLERTLILTEKLRGLVEGFDFGDNLRVTASFGIARYADNETADSFAGRVDEALYKAKNNGRNRVEAL